MEASLDLVRRHRDAGTLLDEKAKIAPPVLGELGEAGYWGMLIDPQYGGQGAPFARFARFLTRMATVDAVVSGLASVHGCIGAVDPVRTFGNAEQKRRFLPRLASGASLSAFALTEPGAGSDMTALKTTAVPVGDEFEVTGEKLFITNAVPGRTIGLVVILEGKPAVLIVDLPPTETEQFRLKTYTITAIRHAHNNGLLFNKLRVPKANLLNPPLGDGLTIAYHGLNLGRVSLAAGAAGTMRVMLASMLNWAGFRKTYGQPIANRELVKRRVARLAALIVGTDAMVAWSSWLIDEGFRGELECIIAKIFGSESMKESAIELFMKTNGGRSFLRGHMFAENLFEYLAPCIYEGEGEILGLAFFKSLVKEHGKEFFEPIGKTLQQAGIKDFKPWNPVHAWKLRRELTSYTRWMVRQKLTSTDRQHINGMDRRLSGHLAFALEQFGQQPLDVSAAMRKHQLKLADRQCRMAELSQRIQDLVVMLVTILSAQQSRQEATIAAADILCQDFRRRLTGERPSDSYFRDVSRLADMVLAGQFGQLEGVDRGQIMMKY